MTVGARFRSVAIGLLTCIGAAHADSFAPPPLMPISSPPGQSKWPVTVFRQRELQPELANLIFVFSCLADVVNSRYQLAVRDCSGAIALSPDTPGPYKFRGEAYFFLGAYTSALTDFNRSVALDSTDAAVFAGRAETFHAMNDFHRALRDFDAAIRLSPGEPRYWNGRCWLRAVWNRNLAKALSDCTIAHRLAPDFAPAMDSRGFVHLRLGAYESAIMDYDVAIKLEDRYARAYFGRGLAKLHLNRNAGGRADIIKARVIDPHIDALFASAGVTGKGLSMPQKTHHKKGWRIHMPSKSAPLLSGAQEAQN